MTIETEYPVGCWARAMGHPAVSGKIRSTPEHFRVVEQLSFEPSGEGEHIFLFIEKRETNTDWLARQLAAHAGVATRDIGYAGMKDRHAVTSQWFSVYLAGKSELDWTVLNSESVKVLKCVRHQRKLKRGALTGNHFDITVTDLKGNIEALLQRLETIRTRGVPNYFGEQRFGRGGKNIENALAMFSGRGRPKRSQRSIYLSAARSWLFNEILNVRIQESNWQRVMTGDVLMLAGSHSVFVAEQNELAALQQRLDEHDLSISGPLAGRGGIACEGDAASLEQIVLNRYPDLMQGLQAAGLEQARRPFTVWPENLQWEIDDRTLTLQFFLPAGSYATALLREIIEYDQAEQISE